MTEFRQHIIDEASGMCWCGLWGCPLAPFPPPPVPPPNPYAAPQGKPFPARGLRYGPGMAPITED